MARPLRSLALALPPTLAVDFNDGTTEHHAVRWSDAVSWIRGPGQYVIPGTTDSGHAVTASVTAQPSWTSSGNRRAPSRSSFSTACSTLPIWNSIALDSSMPRYGADSAPPPYAAEARRGTPMTDRGRAHDLPLSWP